MTMHDDLERVLVGWLHGVAAPRDVELDDVFAQTRSMRQRPAWMSPGRWLPMQLTMPRVVIPRALPILAVIALLVAAFVVVTLITGSQQRRLPPPFGMAATGLFVYDSAGDLFVATSDGRTARPLIAESGEEWGATFSRDGTRIAYWSRPGPGSPVLRVVDADGSDARTVSADLEVFVEQMFPAVSWAPDGRHVAFASGAGELYLIDVDGTSAPTQIGEGPLRRFEPAWSPDGTLIAFRGDGTGEDRGVYVIRPDGSGETRVSQTPANTAYPDRTPVWSADGRLIYHIAVVGLEDNQIFIAERVANRWTETKVPLRAAGAPPTVDSWPQWSNDGRRISFIRSRTDNNGDLMVAATDGIGLRKVGEDVAGFAVQCWSPDDRAIAVINAELDVMIGTESEPGYRVVSVDGTSPPVLIRTPGRRSFDSCSWQRVASQR